MHGVKPEVFKELVKSGGFNLKREIFNVSNLVFLPCPFRIPVIDIKMLWWCSHMVFSDKNFAGQDIATCAELNGNGVQELVPLVERASNGKLGVMVKDAKTGELIGVINF